MTDGQLAQFEAWDEYVHGWNKPQSTSAHVMDEDDLLELGRERNNK